MSFLRYRTLKDKKTNYKSRSSKLIDFKDLKKLSDKFYREKKKIVFTIGSFDLLNPGHCRYIAEARARGDVLVVGVSTDASLKRTKGPEYPLVNENIRAELICHLKTVDFVTMVDEDRPHATIFLLKPHVYFTSKGAWEEGIRDEHEKYLVKSYGGDLIVRPRHEPYFGTESLAEHIANIRVIQTLEVYLKDKVDGFNLDPLKHLKPADYSDQDPQGSNAFDSKKLIVNWTDLPRLREETRKKKLKLVFVAGSFDLLHVGHARFVEQAALNGDVLVVGLPSDKSLRDLKGIGRPVITELSRAYVLGHLDPVDHVVIFDQKSVYDTLEKLKPDVFFTVEEGWNHIKTSKEYKLVKSYGGKVVSAKRQAPFTSASAIIDKLASKKVREIFKECLNEEKQRQIEAEETRLKIK